MDRAQRAVKRGIDILGAALALVITAPASLLVAGLVRWRMGSPVLYCQDRAGRDGGAFTLYKFRTMREAHDASGRPLPDAERLTRLGRGLRTLALDELPQFWNVLRGDMSLVGPRPLYLKYVPRYSPEQARRLHVRPGLTGYAQVRGRNAVSWEERFRLDVWYVDHGSVWTDVKVLLATPFAILSRRGVGAPGRETGVEFKPEKGMEGPGATR